MVHNTNITLINTSTNISAVYDTYLINATGGNITLTLPDITTDGMNYIFNPINLGSTIGITGSNLITGYTAGYSLGTGTFGIQSRSSQWYPFTYSASQGQRQIFQFSLPFTVTSTTGYPGLMGVSSANPPSALGGLVPTGNPATVGYNSTSSSPWYIPWTTSTVTNISCHMASGAVSGSPVVYPVSIRLQLVKVDSTSYSNVSTIDLVIAPTGATAGSPTGFVNPTFGSAVSELSGQTATSIALTPGLYGIVFLAVSGNNSVLISSRALFGSISVTGS